jgi:hypothetical protein
MAPGIARLFELSRAGAQPRLPASRPRGRFSAGAGALTPAPRAPL